MDTNGEKRWQGEKPKGKNPQKRFQRLKSSVKVAFRYATRSHKYAVIRKCSTFATENGNEHSGDTEGLPEIDDVPLQYETDGATAGEEEEVEVAVPNAEKETYDGGIDFERVQEALSVIHRNASSIAERQRAGETLTELEGTHLMETLRNDTVRSSTIDDIVRNRFEELYVPSEGKGK